MTIRDLYKVITKRINERSNKSYVVALVDSKDRMIQKVGEEAIEVVIAAKNDSRELFINEMADLWFHLLVLLAEKKVTIDDIERELTIRHKKNDIGNHQKSLNCAKI